MAVTAEGLQQQISDLQARLILSEEHGMKTATALDELRANADAAIRDVQGKLRDSENKNKKTQRTDLINVKDSRIEVFSGKKTESYKTWAKKFKAFCNTRHTGFRQALEWAEKNSEPIDTDDLMELNWEDAYDADHKLYDLLVMVTADDPQILVENYPDQGFQAWRALARRFDPVGEQFTFDRMTALMHRDRCKDIAELPSAIERWSRDLAMYQAKTGKILPE